MGPKREPAAATKRRPRALVHNRDREAEILAAAREVFEERGFDAASVAEIARRSDVAEGTIYLYCQTKRDLLQKVVTRWYEQLIADSAPGLAELSGARAKIKFLAERHLNAMIENAAIGRLLVSELRSAADYPGSDLHKLNARYARRLVDILRLGIAEGDIPSDARLDIARDLFFGGLEHLALSRASEPAKRAGAIEDFAAMFWRSLRGRG